MENSQKPISPIFNSDGFVSHQSRIEEYNQKQLLSGLTKREYFAGLAMQGLLASRNWQLEPYNKDTPEVTAEFALQITDELLKQLAK